MILQKSGISEACYRKRKLYHYKPLGGLSFFFGKIQVVLKSEFILNTVP
jgi:hypothetical protein